MNKLKIKEGSENYTARVVKIEHFQKHKNADRLWVITVFGQNVITAVEPKKGSLSVFFPALSKLNAEFLSRTNSYEDKEMNKNKEEKGFFNKHGRVRAIRLRGEISEGYLHPVQDVENFLGVKLKEGDSFNMVEDVVFCEKYVKPIVNRERKLSAPKVRKERKSILVDGQFEHHVDTKNLRYNIDQINPFNLISISYKLHGTSFIVSNILTKRKLNLAHKIALKIGFPIKNTEYNFIASSRKVVQNQYEGQINQGFYKENLYMEAMENLKSFIPKGYTIYGEIVGYTSLGGSIQSMKGKTYDYGCDNKERDLYIYRIRVNNEDGTSHELSTQQIIDFCQKYGLKYPPLFHYGQAWQLYPDISTENIFEWREEFIKRLEKDYNEKKCFICKSDVWEEGIVLRKENLFRYEAYKLKSRNFLLGESDEQEKEDFIEIN